MNRLTILALCLLLSTSATAAGEPIQPVVETYKTVGGVQLQVTIFNPPGHRASDRRPAIVFFFGGGWRSGSPKQFEPQCRYLASRGMVAMSADYRVLSRHKTKAVKCVADGKSAVRWIRREATRLGIDPDRVAAGGGSAGGHVAACTALLRNFDEPSEDTSVSCIPNAMVLFNPAAALAPVDGRPALPADRAASLSERLGTDPESLSPAHHVRAQAPPTIMFFGTEDFLLGGARAFCRKMKKAGNRCDLLLYDGHKHGFFNYGRNGNKPFVQTMSAADRFLVSLGWLEGAPTIQDES